MASNAVIGSLRVILGMDSAEFQNGARKAQGTLAGLGASIKSFAAGAVAALSLGAVTASLKSAVDHMDSLGKAAQKIGIPVEQLSGLEYAARLADVSLDDLQSNVGKLNRSLADIAGGGKNDAGSALRAMGVAAVTANGQLRPTTEILSDVAARFATYQDGAEKAALAQALFGKSGAAMIPLLNGGREAIAGATEEARKFGLVVDEGAARSAEQFNDNLTRLKGASEGLTAQIATAMLPAMVQVTDAMVNFAAQGTVAEQIANALQFIMRESAKFILEASSAWQEITTWVNAAGVSFEALTTGDFSGAADAWAKASSDVAAIWAETAERIKQIDGLVQHSNAAMKGDRLGATKAKPAAPIISIGGTSGPGSAATSGSKPGKPLVNDIKEVTASLYDMDLGLAKVQETGSAMGETLSSTFQSWAHDAINGTFKLDDALKGLLATATDLALSGLFQNLFKGGAGGKAGGIGGFIGSLFGFAKGGTIMPGGTGGIDSQLVAFRKSPNERVDITKPGQTLTGGGSNVTYNIDARGADGPGLARLQARLDELSRNHGRMAVAAVTRERNMNAGFA